VLRQSRQGLVLGQRPMGVVALQGRVGIPLRQRRTAPGRSRGQRPAVNHVAPVCGILRTLSPVTRRSLLASRFSPLQRMLLERHLLQQRTGKLEAPHALPPPAEQSSTFRHARGILKSTLHGKVYGYYATATVQNLVFVGRIRRDLAEAVQDHILLMQIVATIRRSRCEADFIPRVQSAVAAVLTEENLAAEDLLRAVKVHFPAYHWIGKALWVHRKTLDGALDAWCRFRAARGPSLWIGRRPAPTYSDGAMQEQWTRVRACYLKLRAECGRLPADEVETRIRASEKPREDVLLRQFKRHVRAWSCALQKEARMKQTAGQEDAGSRVRRRFPEAGKARSTRRRTDE